MEQDGMKGELKGLEKGNLVSLLLDMASLRKENLEWLRLKLKDGAGIEESSRYFKGKIRACIFNGGKPNLNEARRFISNFKKNFGGRKARH